MTKQSQSYTATFVVDRTPDQVYRAINDVRSWWSGRIDGDTDKLGGEFRYRYGDLHDSRQKVTGLVPGKRIAWRVTDGWLSFVKSQGGWDAIVKGNLRRWITTGEVPPDPFEGQA